MSGPGLVQPQPQPQTLPEGQMPARLPDTAFPDTGTIEPAKNVAGSSIMPDTEHLRRRSRSGSLNREQLSNAAANAVEPEPAVAAAAEQATEQAVGTYTVGNASHEDHAHAQLLGVLGVPECWLVKDATLPQSSIKDLARLSGLIDITPHINLEPSIVESKHVITKHVIS